VVYTLTNPTHYPKMLVNAPPTSERMVLRCNCDHRRHCSLCERLPDAELPAVAVGA
jgi:DNA sulfur modification protein DndD